MLILDGKKLRNEIREQLKNEVEGFASKPSLAIVQMGDRKDSNVYIDSKKKFGESIGIRVVHKKLKEEISEEEIIQAVSELNKDKAITGIIVQLPLSKHLDPDKILNTVSPSKDVDGLGAVNVKKVWEGKKDAFIPATTKGILTLLQKNAIELSGKNVLVVGRSSLVGKPTAVACLLKDATVTIAHSKTQDLEKHTKAADIIIVAVGRPNLITKEHVRSGQVIIDVGINPVSKEKQEFPDALEDEIPGKNLVGDVDFESVKDIVSAISPVPGGVGPMTVASLFENVVEAHRRATQNM